MKARLVIKARLVMKLWSGFFVVASLTAQVLPLAAQPAADQAPALPVITGRTAGETAAPGATGPNDAVNPSGNRDQPFVAGAPPPPAPAHPVQPAMSMDEARRKLAGDGLQQIEGFYRDVDGAWRAVAVKDGKPVMAWVDAKGDIGEAPL